MGSAATIDNKSDYEILAEQTVFIHVAVVAYPVKCEQKILRPDICEEILKQSLPIYDNSLGSGTYILHKGKIKVLSVEHLCGSNEPLTKIEYKGVTLTVKTETTITVASKGLRANGQIEKVDAKKDLCLIKLDKQPSIILPEIAKKPLKRGDRVHYAGAPVGFASDTFTLSFEGSYSGTYGDDLIFSLPCKAGTSGSSIRNKDKKIVSIVQKVHTRWHYICFGAPLSSIKEFLK